MTHDRWAATYKSLKVLEETGFDIKPYASEERSISVSIYSQQITLYIVHPVSEAVVFETRTRKEISVRILTDWRNFSLKFEIAHRMVQTGRSTWMGPNPISRQILLDPSFHAVSKMAYRHDAI